MAPETTQHERGASAREQGEPAVVVDATRQPSVGARDWRHTVGTERHTVGTERRTVGTERRTVGTERRTVRTERALLRLRIEALERRVEHKEQRLQEVVDRYEQVMAERDRQRRAAENRTVGEVEIEFEDGENERGLGRWVRAALDRLRR